MCVCVCIAVVVMCMHSVLIGGELQASFLLKAHEMGLTRGRYVFVPYDTLLYSLPHGNASHAPLQNSTKLREAYDAVLTVTVASELMSFKEALLVAGRLGQISLPQQPQQVRVACS